MTEQERQDDEQEDHDTADERAHVARVSAAAWQHEVECYGVADGWHRRPPDPAYEHEAAYWRGRATGQTLPPEQDTEEHEEDYRFCWECGGSGHARHADELAPCRVCDGDGYPPWPA